MTEHQQLHLLCFIGNRLENDIKRASGPSKKELEKLSESCNRSSSSLFSIDGRLVLW